jgi:O-Antigen ligase
VRNEESGRSQRWDLLVTTKHTAENVAGAFVVALFGGIFLFTWPELILSAAVWICAFHQGLGLLSSFQLGSLEIRPSGVANGALLFGATVFWGAHLRESRLAISQAFRPFALFTAFAALRLLDAPDRAIAVKELILFATPLAIGIVAWISFAHGVPKSSVEKQLLMSPLLVLTFLLFEAMSGTAGYDEEGLVSSVGKSIALFGLPVLALALSFWRYEKEKKWPLLAALLALSLILLTVQRMASIVALLVLTPLRFVKLERTILRNVFTWLSVGCVAGWLLLQVPTVQYRFFEHKENPVFDQEESMINTSGRTLVWLVTIEDALKGPFLGQGTGSSEVFIRAAQLPGLDHPHEEYLRVWHDLGIVGLALFLLAWIGRLLRHLKLWRLLDGSPELARPHMAAALACLALMLSFLTDNTLIYTPAQIPVFLLFAIADRSMDGGGVLQRET